MACQEGHAAAVDALLVNPKTRVNPLNKSDYTPLYEAVRRMLVLRQHCWLMVRISIISVR